MRLLNLFFLLSFFGTTAVSVQAAGGQPEELGAVKWGRDLSAGRALAKVSGKPILILFQEVPGCGTCRNYGNKVLSHPLIVEAIESEFVPVAIYNNKGGSDAAVLREFGEPSWNNPVVRIVDFEKKDVVKRVAGNYSQWGMVDAMVKALRAKGRSVPAYLDILAQELKAERAGTETAVFGMYCFWSGERAFGQMKGVVGTEPGFLQGGEVVKVDYDPKVVDRDELVARAKKAGIRQALDAPNISRFRADKEPKYYLSKTHYRSVPMTALQASRANALIGMRKSPDAVLSPQQRQLARKIVAAEGKQWPNVIGMEIDAAWAKIGSAG